MLEKPLVMLSYHFQFCKGYSDAFLATDSAPYFNKISRFTIIYVINHASELADVWTFHIVNTSISHIPTVE